MDVYYMSDSIQYGSFRNPLYRDYEKFPYGTLENTLNSPPKTSGGMQQHQQRNQSSLTAAGQGGKSKGKSAKDSCPFCKEQKKRPLGAYMRKRGQRITSESISEDAEECDDGRNILREDEGAELQDDFETSSPSGSPSAAELAGTSPQQQHNHHGHHHQHQHQRSSSCSYGRQESQDSGCEAK